MRFVKAVCCAIALVAVLAPGAAADEWNKKTIFTFSGPVQIPGVTLAAGTYVFKLADLSGNRHVVQVFDKDEKKIYGTFLAIPDQKVEPSDKPMVMFTERPAGTPTAVKAWFYPGETIGNEFVYPKNQAMKIAKATRSSVLAMEDTSTATTTEEGRRSSMKTAQVTRVDESGQTSVYPTEPSPESQPTTTTATTTSREERLKTSSGNANVVASDQGAVGTSGGHAKPTRKHLPRTAGSLALLELLSGASIAAGFAVRRLRSR